MHTFSACSSDHAIPGLRSTSSCVHPSQILAIQLIAIRFLSNRISMPLVAMAPSKLSTTTTAASASDAAGKGARHKGIRSFNRGWYKDTCGGIGGVWGSERACVHAARVVEARCRMVFGTCNPACGYQRWGVLVQDLTERPQYIYLKPTHTQFNKVPLEVFLCCMGRQTAHIEKKVNRS